MKLPLEKSDSADTDGMVRSRALQVVVKRKIEEQGDGASIEATFSTSRLRREKNEARRYPCGPRRLKDVHAFLTVVVLLVQQLIFGRCLNRDPLLKRNTALLVELKAEEVECSHEETKGERADDYMSSNK